MAWDGPRWLPRGDTVTSVLSSQPGEAVGAKGDGVAKGPVFA